MAGLLDSLVVGKSGVMANQKAMEVIGNNVANVNTPGYSRQTAEIESLPTLQSGRLALGQGVNVDRIVREHDVFVSEQLRETGRNLGRAEAKSVPLQELERAFSMGKDSLATKLDEFFGAWQDLTTNPGGSVERNIVIREGQNLVSSFQEIYAELDKVSSNINHKLRSGVDAINNKLQQVADLNERIMNAKAMGRSASSAQDKRDVLLRELSGRIGTTTYFAEDGSASVSLPNGGPALVQGTDAYRIEDKGGPDAAFRLVMGDTKLDIADKNFGGEYQGLMEVRDRLIPDLAGQTDELRHDVATTVNEQHQAGMGLDGVTGRPFFAKPTFWASDNSFANPDANGFQAGNIDIDVADASGTVINSTTVSVTDVDSDGDVSLQDIRDSINDADAGVIASIRREESSGEYRLSMTPKGSEQSVDSVANLANIANTDALGGFSENNSGAYNMEVAVDDVSEIAAGRTGSPGDNENAMEISGLADQELVNGEYTFGDFYGKISADVGIEVQQNDMVKGGIEDTMVQLENSRDEKAGVSLKEEMVNLTRFQKGFQASAKFISTVDRMLSSLLAIKR